MANVEAQSDRGGAGAPAAAPPAPAPSSEDLAHLYKMSPTAGVATTDYAAINVTAIAALLLGLGSVVALAGNILLIVPLGGIVCALVALASIRDSNGTQTGRGFALLGLVLSIGIGGTIVTLQLAHWMHNSRDEHQIAAVMSQVGDDLHAEKYEALYDRSSERFRARVPRETFMRAIDMLNRYPQFGRVKSVRWNEEPMYFQTNPDTGDETVTAMTLIEFAQGAGPMREIMVFVRQGGQWVVDDIPQLFPAERKRKASARPPVPAQGP